MTAHDHDQVGEPPPPSMRATEGVRWVYQAAFYDGPIDGMVTAPSTGQVWAEMFEECGRNDEPCGFYRRYRLIRLTPEAAAEEARRRALFRQHVGTHFDCDEEGRRDHSGVRPKEEWHKFYDAAAGWPEWKPEGELVGWFQS